MCRSSRYCKSIKYFLYLQPMFKMTSQVEDIEALSSGEYKTLKDTFNGNQVRLTDR